jgi:hypothetical protein
MIAHLAGNGASGLLADPGAEPGQLSVDGGVGGGAASGSPGSGSNQLPLSRRSLADEGSTGVTVAGTGVLVDLVEDADHVVVLEGHTVLGAAEVIADDGGLSLLEGDGNGAGSAGTAPAGDVAGLRLAVDTGVNTAGNSNDGSTVEGNSSADNSDIVGGETSALVVLGVTDDGADIDNGTLAAVGCAHLDAVGADGSTDAVAGRDDPVGVHDRATAAERATAQPATLPAPFIGTSGRATDDVGVGAAADGRGVGDESENNEHLHTCNLLF